MSSPSTKHDLKMAAPLSGEALLQEFGALLTNSPDKDHLITAILNVIGGRQILISEDFQTMKLLLFELRKVKAAAAAN